MSTLTNSVAGRLLQAAGVRIERLPGGIAAISLDDSGYTLHLGDAYYALPEGQQAAVLAHELGHLVRGDCLAPAVKSGDKASKRAWNVAADAVINVGTLAPEVRRLGGVTYDLIAGVPSGYHLPDTYLPPAQVIYEHLRRIAQEIANALDQDIQPASGEKARAEHARAVLKVREAARREECSELPESIRQQIGASLADPSERAPAVVEQPAMAALRRILEAVRGTGSGAPTRVRSWERPGRTEYTRGVSRRPRKRVALAIDVSGSMIDHYPLLAGLQKALSRDYAVTVIAFDDAVRHVGERLPANAWRGGGTLFGPVFEHPAARSADVLIMATDAYAADSPALPRVPVVWVLTESHGKVDLRPQDRSIKLERKGQ